MRDPATLARPRSLSLLLLILLAALTACRGERSGKPSKEYIDSVSEETISAFYVGLAALETGDDKRAEDKLTRVTQLVPQEPAAWANLGLLSLRRADLDVASERLQRARSLAPNNSQISFLLGLLESRRGQPSDSVSYLRRAVKLDSHNLPAAYALAREIERQGAAPEAQRVIEKVAESQPNNPAILLELARFATVTGDTEKLARTIECITQTSSSWPAEAREQLEELRNAAAAQDLSLAATRVGFLRNVLVRLPEYRQGLARVQSPPDRIAEPLARMLLLPSPSSTAAPHDEALRFAPEPLPSAGSLKWEWMGAILLREQWTPSILAADGRKVKLGGGVTLSFPGGAAARAPAAYAILGLDYNYDFNTDIAVAGAGGLRLFRQDAPNKFSDVTARALPAAVTGGAYVGAWAADLEADGDLDMILGATEGPPVVLRNNGDGTFEQWGLFEGVSSLRGFVWADLDGDGDDDAAMIDAGGRLRVFSNERLGRFNERSVPEQIGKIAAITAAEMSGDGVMDLVALQADGAVVRLSDKDEGAGWNVAELARWNEPAGNLTSDSSRIFVADLDNNGGLDVIVSGPVEGKVWLIDVGGQLQPLAEPLPRARIFSVADLYGDGKLDLLGLTEAGQPVELINRAQRDYHWKEIRTRAKQATGDQRINPFGIGGEIEARSGLLVQKQPIATPITHFGLGKNTQADVVRIIWPNGSVQADFELASDIPSGAPAVFDQRLEGSCPFLFANDGRGVKFVTDFIWRSPLGLRINAQDTASVMQTEDWVKIRGDQLEAIDGFYDVRITAELWETHFFDHVSLMMVDHPAGTEVFTDERMAMPPAPLKVYAVSQPQPVSRALDDQGQDVTEIVRARDGRYLDTFGRGQYQGVTRDHYVELDLSDEAPNNGPLWLIAYGWTHPTDSSINVALGQGRHDPPKGLSLEVADAKGGWVVAKKDLGFPEGKSKTILISLDGVFGPGAPKRVRLRTNLEIYWDSIELAQGLPDSVFKSQQVGATTAELRYRGFSAKARADVSSPELPDYNALASTLQRRRDLIGYHTRFGDVRELIEKVDDRYVIMNAGDEMAVRFAAPSSPPQGWVRDFVLIGDGWEKDGNYNTTFSKTVLPLPSHNQPAYTTPPRRLEDDPVYKQHRGDWEVYHTRYVTPESFQKAMQLARRE
jgi:Tfp pilus assembly protein PilF